MSKQKRGSSPSIKVTDIPVEVRAKHCAAAAAPAYDPFRAIRRKVVLGVSALALSGLVLCPGSAFAAEWIDVDGTHYDTVGASGTGWIWSSQDDLNLDGYNGTGISAKGDLNLIVKNKNTVDATNNGAGKEKTGVSVKDGDLTIKGDGELNVKAKEKAITAEGDGTKGGNITIDGATVNAEATGNGAADNDNWQDENSIDRTYGIDARDSNPANRTTVTIENGAKVNVVSGNEQDPEDLAWGITGTNVTISDSTVGIKANAVSDAYGIFASNAYGTSQVWIENNSKVDIFANAALYDAYGILAGSYELSTGPSNVYIWDSEVRVRAEAARQDNGQGDITGGYGISVRSQVENEGSYAAGISICNSDVYARGSVAALYAWNDCGSNADAPRANIVIFGGSSIKVPEGGAVRNFGTSHEYEGATYYTKGMVVGAAGEGSLGDVVANGSAAKDAQILCEGTAPSDDPWAGGGSGGGSGSSDDGSGGGSGSVDNDNSSGGTSGGKAEVGNGAAASGADGGASLVRKAYADELGAEGSAVASTPKTADSGLGFFAAVAAVVAGAGAAFGGRFGRKRGRHARR